MAHHHQQLTHEQALKRSEELEAVGQTVEATDVLYSCIRGKRFKIQGWSTSLEQLMLKFIDFCVEQQKLQYAKEALIQYRAVCQATNVQSLDVVFCRFRDYCIERLLEVSKKAEGVRLDSVGDLEGDELPEELLLTSFQTDRDLQSREVHQAFRFVWEAFKIILDTLKANNRLERVYHDTARKAFKFCNLHSRPQEFKRLCERIRNHYMTALRNAHSNKANQALIININSPETFAMNLDTRFAQLSAAADLDLWRECYATAEDIYGMMTKSGARRAAQVAQYYERLQQIFWKGEDYLFHGCAWLKQCLQVRTHKNHATDAELEHLSTNSALAVLAIPLRAGALGGEGLNASAEIHKERCRRMSQLIFCPVIPTRESLKADVVSKDILRTAHESCRKLYRLLENDFTPLTLCKDSLPLLDELPEYAKQYILPVKKVICHKIVTQLTTVYSSLRIESFTSSICPNDFLSWVEAEKVIVELVHKEAVELRIDYSRNAIFFGTKTSSGVQSRLVDLAEKLDTLDTAGATKKTPLITDSSLRSKYIREVQENVDKEQENVKLRLAEITRRVRQQKKEKERLDNESKRRVEESRLKEEEAELKRRNEEKKKRYEDQEHERRRLEERQQREALLNSLMQTAGKNAKIEGVPLNEFDISKVKVETLLKAHDEQKEKERMEKIKQRKLEAKRVDHFARALRETEVPLLDEWEKDRYQRDLHEREEFVKAEKERQEKEKIDRTAKRQMVLHAKPMRDKWIQNKLVDSQKENEKLLAQDYEAARRRIKEEKIRRAKDRMDEAEATRRQKEKEEEAHKEREEAIKRDQAELARKEQEDSERRKEDELRRKQELVQKQRDEEIEAMLIQQQSHTAASSSAANKDNLSSQQHKESSAAGQQTSWRDHAVPHKERSTQAYRAPVGRDHRDRDIERDRGGDRDRDLERNRGGDRDRDLERNRGGDRDLERNRGGDRDLERDRGGDRKPYRHEGRGPQVAPEERSWRKEQ